MRFLIFGGTGECGTALIRKALAVYPDSTIFVYVRSPQKLPKDLAENTSVKVIEGTLTELDKVEAALLGQTGGGNGETSSEPHPVDVVLSALGPTGPRHPANQPITSFYKSLIDLMAKHAIKRIVVLCTPSHPDPQDKFSPTMFAIVTTVRMLAYTAYAEFRAVGEVVRQRGDEKELEWTVVRVPLLTDQDKEDVVAGYVGNGKVGNVLSRKAFAAFCIREVEKKEWVRKAPLICNA